MSTLNNSVQYISVIRPGEKVAKLVKRMHYVSFVGMFRSDLFEAYVLVMPRKNAKSAASGSSPPTQGTPNTAAAMHRGTSCTALAGRSAI